MTGLLLDSELSPEQREYAEIVRLSGENLLHIINDILDFSKIEAGKMDLETTEFELRAAVEGVVGFLAEKAQSKGLDLSCVFRPGVPDRVAGDPIRLRQILTNLVGNAVKFTDSGEVSLTVSAGGSDGAGTLLHFAVSDTGMGIPLEGRSRLFQSFSQVDGSTTRKHGGTGLGLAISKRLVEMMGGRSAWRARPAKEALSGFSSAWRIGRPSRGPGRTP